MDRKPIFFAWTRSFWSAILTAVLMIHDVGEPMVRAIMTPIALMFGGDPDEWSQLAVDVLPLLTLAFAIQQRSGAARPYTSNPRALS